MSSGRKPLSCPNLPESPKLEHIACASKWTYMFPHDLTVTTTLELRDVDLSLKDFSKIFSSAKRLKCLLLEFHTSFGYWPPGDPVFFHGSHNSISTEKLIELPSLEYLSVHLPAPSWRICTCPLPLLYMPNLKVLDVTRGPCYDPREAGEPADLGHFHPRNVERSNRPASPIHKIRFNDIGWKWSADAFKPKPSAAVKPITPPFTKSIDVEWVDGIDWNKEEIGKGCTLKTLRVKTQRVMYTEDVDFEEELDSMLGETDGGKGKGKAKGEDEKDDFRMQMKDVPKLINLLSSLLVGPITLQPPRRYSTMEVVRSAVARAAGTRWSTPIVSEIFVTMPSKAELTFLFFSTHGTIP